ARTSSSPGASRTRTRFRSTSAGVCRRCDIACQDGKGMAETPSGALRSVPTGDHRRRRPVGEPPPLPRDLHGFAPMWIGVVILLALVYWWGRSSGAAGTLQRTIDRIGNEHVSDLSASWRRSAPRGVAHGVRR